MRTWSVQKQDFGVKCELFGAKTKYLVFTNLVRKRNFFLVLKHWGWNKGKHRLEEQIYNCIIDLDNSEQNSSFLVLKRCQKGQKQDFGAK